LGGLNRTDRSRSYLFSGLLVCGTCGSRLIITSGNGKRAYVRYGCPSHRYLGVCENDLTIRQKRLEEQLIGAIEQRILNSNLLDYTLQQFHAGLANKLAEMQLHASGLDELRRERQSLKAKADRVVGAVAEVGHSPALLAKFGEVDAQIGAVDRRIDEQRPVNLTATIAETREFVFKSVLQLRTVLREDAGKSKPALARQIGQLKLTPKQTENDPVYEVAGAVELLN
jgi:hypothetical protein